jgi:oxygen-independent coproporphyrinogen-3 oxidase
MEPNADEDRVMVGFYLHVPFCQKKCSYCDFYSIESTEHIARFVDTLKREILLRADAGAGNTFTSVFFGGGTPSLLHPDEIDAITSLMREHFTFAEDCEWTMECNPGTVTLERLRGYRRSGINRLSFGVQSFQQTELDFLDRIHDADEAVAAMQLAREAGFDNVNMDLMFAVPGQTIETLRDNLRRMIELNPDHVSAYSLIYEHGTPLYSDLIKGRVKPLPEEVDAEMYHTVISTLRNAGYEQYEVSNFARSGRRCRHNLTYWHGEPYLAVGPSAHGFVGTTRYWNFRSLSAWTEHVMKGALPEANHEHLSESDLLTEHVFLHLRADGLRLADISRRFGIDVRSMLQPDLTYWIEEGFVNDRDDVLSLTAEGYRVCDEISSKAAARLAG